MAIFNDRIQIDETQALPEFDIGAAKAYAATNKNTNAAPLMALVVYGHLPARLDMIAAFRSLSSPSVAMVHEAAVIDWPLTGQRHVAIIYQMMKGQRLAPVATGNEAHGSFTAIKETNIIEEFIKPIGTGICQMAKMDLFHGAIRADNMFVGDGHKIVLGDCLTAPCGYRQPAQYETPQRAMAPDIARGPGTAGDDFYAFGVAVIVALTGDIPMRGLSNEAIIQMKIERGSYAALAGEKRFSQATIELLRGLLTDDANQRWNVEDFEQWLAGRRLTPRQSTIGKKASRPFKFGEVEYVQLRQLLWAMSSDTRLAAALITNQELARWISHGFSDEKAIKHLDQALIATRKQRVGPEEERLVSNVQIALDPSAPMRYRGLSIFPGGLPVWLAHLMLQDAPLTLIAELMINKLPVTWLDYQTDKSPEVIVAVQLCEKAVDMVQNKALGFGLERFVYDSNPSLPCLNPQLRERYVLTPRQLLDNMERRAPLGGLQLIDRHIAAFLMARDKNTSAMVMQNIDQMRELTKRNIGILKLYAQMQERYGPDQLKNLAALLLPLTEEAVKRFHNRPRQERVRKDLKAAAATGILNHMLELVDDTDTVIKDAQEYVAAKMLYQETEAEAERLSNYAKDKKMLAEQAGQPLAAVIAVGLSFVVLLVILLRLFQ